ncbi:hypothetical protein COC65_13120 [Bacillus thuringiensis]|uniref:hypothetical protein n=1 Tax=Bacillus cereus group TaxID=86661 RepID=UPI000BED2841|nr:MULTISPECIES: hypothetical protein [Bacillus cereus group]PEC10156.1 hypothetical protein CON55_14625 [Bacillus toyonensis]PGS43983.1 hypothetical protein COC65_13120 [Bacillus thuringiensis]HDR8043312.1 hypothetical protein [Bacillus cereus]
MSRERVKIQFQSEDIKGEIEGYSNMPYWNHDLKLEVILKLLSTVDQKQFLENQNHNQLEYYTKEIIKMIEVSLGVDGLYQLVYEDE